MGFMGEKSVRKFSKPLLQYFSKNKRSPLEYNLPFNHHLNFIIKNNLKINSSIKTTLKMDSLINTRHHNNLNLFGWYEKS